MTWIKSAVKRPIAFAQVREDALQDIAIAKAFQKDDLSITMVASGGCTACALTALGIIKTLHLVDPNPAQLALTRLKLSMLNDSIEMRLHLLGHLSMDNKERSRLIISRAASLGIPTHLFANINEAPDQTGRYEYVFARLRRCLEPHALTLQRLFEVNTLEEQASLLAPDSAAGIALDMALERVMEQNNLVLLFGKKATANRLQPFARHFASRIRYFLATQHACQSPYLAQMLLGHFFGEIKTPWLTMECRGDFPQTIYHPCLMDEALQSLKSDSQTIVHLSNILDWLSPREALKTLQLAWKALIPGGKVVIRQLNSNLNIPYLGVPFRWLKEPAEDLHAADRSFFYRNFYIGEK